MVFLCLFLFSIFLCNFSMIFDHFGRHFGAPRVTFRDSVLKWGSLGPPRAPETKQ